MTTSCPICGSTELTDFSSRPRALCVQCGALERQRALAVAFGPLFEAGEGREVLEIGPLNATVFGDYLRARGWRYVSADRSRRGNPHDPRDVSFIDIESDARKLSKIRNGTMDLVIAQHVIEEIPEYERAISEVSRVLHGSGSALLEIPFDPSRLRSEPHQPDGFGNVWRFGADLPETVRKYFAHVDIVSLAEQSFTGRLLACRKS